MAYTPTVWKDRVVEKPRTYTIVNNPDGTVTLTPAPGTVIEAGTPVSAAEMNKLAGQYEKALEACGPYGDKSDGAFDSAGNTTLPVPVEDESIIVKQYTSFKLNAGHTYTVNKRCKGLIIKVAGDVHVDGTIDMTDKSANIASSDGTLVLNLTPFAAVLPSGGSSGAGGKGATTSFSNPTLGNNAGIGGLGADGLWFGGACGGGGGGGFCFNVSTLSGKGGNGGDSNPGSSGGLGGAKGVQSNPNGGLGAYGAGGGGGASASAPAATGGAGGSSINGGGAGGGGGASYSYNGADGAAGINWGGGLLIIIAAGDITIGSSGVIRANGGNGGNGGAAGAYVQYADSGTGGGGGGGGGGGIVMIAHKGVFINNGSIQVNGGAGGTGGAGTFDSTTDGENGQPGTIGSIQVIKAV